MNTRITATLGAGDMYFMGSDDAGCCVILIEIVFTMGMFYDTLFMFDDGMMMWTVSPLDSKKLYGCKDV